jgi:hypothetical protein
MGKRNTLHYKTTKSQQIYKIYICVCENHTYLTKIERKNKLGDSRPKLTLNHLFLIDQQEKNYDS